MRYTLASEHHDFFAKQGFISFDDLLPLPLIEEAEKAIKKNERDLWRKNEALKKIVLQRTYAQIVADLTHTKYRPHRFRSDPLRRHALSFFRNALFPERSQLRAADHLRSHDPFYRWADPRREYSLLPLSGETGQPSSFFPQKR